MKVSSHSSISIRLATEDDLPAMLEIYNDIIVNTTAVYDYEPHTLEMRKQWFATKEQQGFPVFAAEENHELVGFSTIGPFRREWTAYRYSVENSVYVKSGARGKGIGKLLLAPLIGAARNLKMHTIIAGIEGTNEASIKLHKSFGFEEVAHFKEVGWKFERWLDLTFLQLII
ncbi:MAG: N-acetyltransferase family protein [Bacteroidota bacterium]